MPCKVCAVTTTHDDDAQDEPLNMKAVIDDDRMIDNMGQRGSDPDPNDPIGPYLKAWRDTSRET